MSETMMTAVLLEANRFEIQERPVPEPGPGEVLIWVRAVGICGSDTHYFDGRRDKEPNTVYPYVLGHEYAGEVAAAGPGCDGVEVGSRVVPSPLIPCGGCEWCGRDMPNLCPNVTFAGSDGVEGTLCEYYVTKKGQLHPLPDSVSFDHAVVVEPLAIALHMVETLIRPEPDWTCAVIGAGPIGLAATFCLRQQCSSDIFVSDKVRARREAALHFGATDTFDASSGSFVDYVMERTGDRGVDVSVEAAGEVDTVGEAVLLACRGGRVLIEGIASETSIALPVREARRRELEVVFGTRSRHKDGKALEMIQNGMFDAGRFVTHTFPLEKTQEAYEMARDYADGVLKAVINP
jgi:L-iditol 2-dehydrogenase